MAIELEREVARLPVEVRAEPRPGVEPVPTRPVITSLQRGPGNLAVARLLNKLAAGQALDVGTRALMETRFGRELSGVRIHTDHDAAATVRALGTTAFAVGRDIAFEAGRYRPDRPEGQRLIAHEIAHVVQ